MDSSSASANIINGNYALTYSANDWFYMKSSCSSGTNKGSDCSDNEVAVQNLRQSTNDLGASMTQYNDAKILYNRELLFTFNILIGLGLICYYIYLNQDVLPDPSAALQKLGTMAETASASAKSGLTAASSKFSMAPTAPAK